MPWTNFDLPFIFFISSPSRLFGEDTCYLFLPLGLAGLSTALTLISELITAPLASVLDKQVSTAPLIPRDENVSSSYASLCLQFFCHLKIFLATAMRVERLRILLNKSQSLIGAELEDGEVNRKHSEA